VHFTSDGWLTPVVNPDQFGVQGQHSPESEAFTLELQAAYIEWVAGGSLSGSVRIEAAAAAWAWIAACVVLGSLLAYT